MIQDWQPADSKQANPYDMEAQHEFARKLATNSFVLLKNENAVLPINKGDKLAVIGELAAHPRYQGSGSSHVNAHRLVTPLETINQVRPDATFVAGYSLTADRIDQAAIAEAVDVAKSADKVIIFAGYPERLESEGFDKTSIDLPANQNQLIERLARLISMSSLSFKMAQR